MDKLDKTLTKKIYDFLRKNFNDVVVDHDSKETHYDFFVSRDSTGFSDHLAVYLDCDNNLTISANCWDQKNDVLLENAVNGLIA
tara:strand:- start:2253 stop:2504 length:252 start_codon:yes stop_codon:yes gene_type:complete